MLNLLRGLLRGGWIAVLLLILSVWGALAQGNGNRPKFVNGELLLGFSRGTPRATVDAAATNLSATVVYSFGTVDAQESTDVYHVRMAGAQTVASTEAALLKAKQDVRVKAAWYNQIYYPAFQTGGNRIIPNDPRWNEQWNMTQIRMPEAWTLEKGKDNVVIAVIDTGVDTDHPDITKRIFMPYDAVAQDTDPRPAAGNTHGTFVAGFIFAQTNNGVGVAGMAWEGIRLMPILAGTDAGGFAAGDLTRAIQFVTTQKTANPNLQFVCNLSLAADVPSDTPPTPMNPFEAAIIDGAQKGIVYSIAAGNQFGAGNPPQSPAYLSLLHKNILGVAATSELRTKAGYSSVRPNTITIAAPGGDAPAQGRAILSLYPVVNGSFALEPTGGTSSAAPHVAGAAGLLLSVPGVLPANVKDILTSTAQRVGGAPRTEDLGAGILDVYAALEKVAIGVTIITPDGTGGKATGRPGTPLPIETLQPEIRIRVTQITPDRLTVKVDGITIPQLTTPGQTEPAYTIENITAYTTDVTSGTQVPVSYDVVIRNLTLSPGQHVIEVIGVKPGNPNDITVTDTRRFTIEPHLIPAGRAMISIPYYEETNGVPPTPETYFGADFILARWVPEQSRYAFYSSFGVRDPLASFQPPDVVTHLEGETKHRGPVGIGYFSNTEFAKPVLTRGQALTSRPFIIPLKGNGSGSDRFISWNMVGDPFPFDVPFNSLLVDTPTGRISITEAVTRGLILPNIFSYDNANGYTYRTLPDGALRAWQAHWIGVTSRDNINLVVPPNNSQTRSRAVGAPAPQAPEGGWTLQLTARAKNLHDGFNFIGVSSRAVDGYDRTDVPKPPISGPYVTLGISNPTWGRQAGTYAADIKSAAGSKTWIVQVETDQANENVSVGWSGRTLPRTHKLTIKDETSGQVVDMRTRSTLSFNSGASAGTRKFTVTATPQAAGAPLRISNLAVRTPGSRSVGSHIGFTLSADANYDVRVLSGTGGHVNTLTSRAGAAGDVNLFWNGKDASGKNVASGSYTVQIRATTPDGESVKVIYPFYVVR